MKLMLTSEADVDLDEAENLEILRRISSPSSPLLLSSLQLSDPIVCEPYAGPMPDPPQNSQHP